MQSNPSNRLFSFYLIILVHGYINGHIHKPYFNGTLRDLYNFATYYKTQAAEDELVLLFDTGDLVDVCVLFSSAHLSHLSLLSTTPLSKYTSSSAFDPGHRTE